MTPRRRFTAPTDEFRCEATRSPLGDGTLARCMHRKRPGSPFCAQHQLEANARVVAAQAAILRHKGA